MQFLFHTGITQYLPLTSSEIFKVCVLHVCLYESENWLLTDSCMDKSSVLRSFSLLRKVGLNQSRHNLSKSYTLALLNGSS